MKKTKVIVRVDSIRSWVSFTGSGPEEIEHLFRQLFHGLKAQCAFDKAHIEDVPSRVNIIIQHTGIETIEYNYHFDLKSTPEHTSSDFFYQQLNHVYLQSLKPIIIPVSENNI